MFGELIITKVDSNTEERGSFLMRSINIKFCFINVWELEVV